jgi:hypothetical protein
MVGGEVVCESELFEAGGDVEVFDEVGGDFVVLGVDEGESESDEKYA